MNYECKKYHNRKTRLCQVLDHGGQGD